MQGQGPYYPVSFNAPTKKVKIDTGYGAGLGSLFGGLIGAAGYFIPYVGGVVGPLTSIAGSVAGRYAGSALEREVAPTYQNVPAPMQQSGFGGGM